MTAFDYAALAILSASVVLGAWRGLVSEILALAAWVAAFFAGRAFAPDLAPALSGWIAEPALRYVAAFAIIALAVLVAVALARLALSKLLRAVGLGALDRTLGAMFGAARGLAVVLAAVLVGGLTAAPQQPWWRNARLAPLFETAVVAARPWLPPMLAKRIKYR